jgi:hypothetical protein
MNVTPRRVCESKTAQVLIDVELTGSRAENVHVVAVEMNGMGNSGSTFGLLDHPVRPLLHVSAGTLWLCNG